MHPFSEERADAVAECAAGYAANLLPALAGRPLPEAYAELQEMFRNAIAAYFAGLDDTWPPVPSEN